MTTPIPPFSCFLAEDITAKKKYEFWSSNEAKQLCTVIESVCPEAGCHVALTGGALYKPGPRKDCDIIFYRIRQIQEIDMDKLWQILAAVNVNKISGFGWCYKAEYGSKILDCLFPEADDGHY